MKTFLNAVVCLSALILAGAANAQDDPSLDDLMEGFEEPKSEPKPKPDSIDQLLEGFDDAPQEVSKTEPQAAVAQRNWELHGFTTLAASYNYQHEKPAAQDADFRGLSRLRWTVQPELEVSLPRKWEAFFSARGYYDFAYSIQGRDQYRSEYLDEYERELELREAFVTGAATDDIDLKLGRQIVVWGKSDTIRVVDVLNPLDFREPGLVDIEGLRLPVTMLRADYYYGDWSLTGIVIPEIRMNKMPVFGSDYYTFDKDLPHDKPESSIDNTEYALALSGIFSGWDLSFHAADVYDDQFYVVANQTGPVQLKHARLQMLGAATNVAVGSWLVKSELAIFNGVKVPKALSRDMKRVDVMAGVDYSGITDHTFSLETVIRHVLDFDKATELGASDEDENEMQYAIRYTGNFMREKLQLLFLASVFGAAMEDGGFYRLSADYELRRATSVTAGVLVYQSGDSPLFEKVARNDRLFLEFRYDF